MNTPAAMPMARRDGSSSRWRTWVARSRRRRQEKTMRPDASGRPGALGGRLGDRDRHLHLLALSQDAQADRTLDGGVQHEPLEVLEIAHRRLAEAHDDVVRLDAGL